MASSQAYAQVDAVGPDVDVVRGGQVALAKRLVVGLPLGGQTGHGGRGKAGRGAEELLERGHEVAAGQAVQVEKRQHLADLRRLPCPGRQDRRGEPLALARLLVDALVVLAWSFDLDRPGRGRHVPGLVVSVADHEPPPALVLLIGQLGYVGVNFGLQRGGQHPPGTLPDDLVDQGPASRRAVLGDYREHGRTFTADGPTSAYSIPVNRSPGKVRPSRPTRGRSSGIEHCSLLAGVYMRAACRAAGIVVVLDLRGWQGGRGAGRGQDHRPPGPSGARTRPPHRPWLAGSSSCRDVAETVRA